MQSLLCLLHDSSGVNTTGQIVLYVDAQKSEVRDPLHTVTNDKQWLNIYFIPSKVYDQLLSLGGVQNQVVFYTPH